jgi:hypothetical protein
VQPCNQDRIILQNNPSPGIMFQNNLPTSSGIFSKGPFHLPGCVLVARLYQAAWLHSFLTILRTNYVSKIDSTQQHFCAVCYIGSNFYTYSDSRKCLQGCSQKSSLKGFPFQIKKVQNHSMIPLVHHWWPCHLLHMRY